MRRMLTFVCALVVTGGPVMAQDHVRVVFDVSQSMRDRDPDRLAPLATALLYDLVNQDAVPGPTDSFEVIPFHETFEWEDIPACVPDQRPHPPPDVGDRIVVDRTGSEVRDRFQEQLFGVGYDAQWTYFYPGLDAAIRDFEQLGADEDRRQRRVVVIVTDGLSDEPDSEKCHLQESVKRLDAVGGALYVLAFGPEAEANRTYFEELSTSALTVRVLTDPDGDRLVESMVEIFSTSFGFRQEPSQALLATQQVDVGGAEGRSQTAAVVAYRPGPDSEAPTLNAPGDPGPTMPSGFRSASGEESGYTMAWVLDSEEPFTITAERAGGSLDVLRRQPVRLEIILGPAATRAIRDRPMTVQVRVSPADGAPGDPGPVNLVVRAKNGDNPPGDWIPDIDDGQVEPEGRVYTVRPTFSQAIMAGGDTRQPPQLDFLALRGETVVGELLGHPVTVYPPRAFAADPPVIRINEGAPLGWLDKGCSTVTLRQVQGVEPFHVQATGTSGQGDRDGDLRAMTLDGESVVGDQGARRTVSVGGGDGTEYALCLTAGRSPEGGLWEGEVRFAGVESPYAEYGQIQRVTVRAELAPPNLLDRWLALAGVLAMGGTLVAMLWYGRDRPFVPYDLRVSVGPGSSGATPAPTESLEPGGWWQRLSGRPVPRAICPAGHSPVGAVCPVDEELYAFAPAAGMSPETGAEERMTDGRLRVGESYTVVRDEDGTRYGFRVDYE